MSLDKAKAFLQKAKADDALRAKVEELDGDGAAGAKLGAEHGFEFAAADFVTAYDELFGLSADDLSSAAGGLGGLKPKIDLD